MTPSAFLEQARSIVSAPNVDVGSASLVECAHDRWPLSNKLKRLGDHPHLPDAVVRPRSEDEVAAVLRLASGHRVPVTARGLGSAVTGAPLPTAGGIVLDLASLTGPPVLDRVDHTVTVPAGVRGSDLEAQMQDASFTLGHSPQSLGDSSVGGWLSTLATGQFSSRYGGIEDLVVGYRFVRADGTLLRLGAYPRGSRGPDFRRLFLGSEGTLGIVTEVTLKVFPVAAHRVTEAFVVPDVRSGIETLRAISQSGTRPFLARLYDENEACHALADPDAESPVLFLGHEGIKEVAEAEHRAASAVMARAGAVSVGAAPVDAWIGRRFDFSTVAGYLDSDGGYAETIEVAALWSKIGDLYASLTAALRPLADKVLGHFSHIYPQGTSLYVILLGRLSSDREAVDRISEIWDVAMRATVGAGAELSHHHGIGLARQRFLAGLDQGVTTLARDLKRALDPEGILNPGKLFDR